VVQLSTLTPILSPQTPHQQNFEIINFHMWNSHRQHAAQLLQTVRSAISATAGLLVISSAGSKQSEVVEQYINWRQIRSLVFSMPIRRLKAKIHYSSFPVASP